MFLGALERLLLMVSTLLLRLECFSGFLGCLRFPVYALSVVRSFLVLGLVVARFLFFLLFGVVAITHHTLCLLFGGFCFCLFLLL